MLIYKDINIIFDNRHLYQLIIFGIRSSTPACIFDIGCLLFLKTRLRHQQLELLDNKGKHSKQWTYLSKYFLFSYVLI